MLAFKRRGLGSKYLFRLHYPIGGQYICSLNVILGIYHLEVLHKYLASFNLLFFEASRMGFCSIYWKMVRMTNWRSCSSFYDIDDCKIVGICVMLSCLIMYMSWKPMWRCWREILDVRACGDHFLEGIIRFSIGVIRCPSPSLCR